MTSKDDLITLNGGVINIGSGLATAGDITAAGTLTAGNITIGSGGVSTVFIGTDTSTVQIKTGMNFSSSNVATSGTAQLTVDSTGITVGGKLSSYNGISTAGLGIPVVVFSGGFEVSYPSSSCSYTIPGIVPGVYSVQVLGMVDSYESGSCAWTLSYSGGNGDISFTLSGLHTSPGEGAAGSSSSLTGVGQLSCTPMLIYASPDSPITVTATITGSSISMSANTYVYITRFS